MRWEAQTVENDARHRLPGYRDPATVRTFDAPEALDLRFYEVQAKSALNRVPPASRMSFRWTVNPYRGCTHACVYCLHGDTPVLMADGRQRAIADLREGDEIYGTRIEGRYRRYVPTTVLAHWATRKPAFRVTLEDGTELVTSADHRFLSDRGWKHVTGRECGAARRPHLTPTNRLIGTGRFARPPVQGPDYRRGYLCGLIRGDGHIGSYEYDRPGRARSVVHRFRLALTDLEPLTRARDYLAGFEVETQRFLFAAAAGTHRASEAIRTSSRANVARTRDLLAWPTNPSTHWRRGYLAGIFDAEGSFGGGIVRICNTDAEIIDAIGASLTDLGLSFVIEDRGHANGPKVVRITGGLAEQLRFMHSVDPATTRKRDITGRALKGRARLGVVSIESLNAELPMYDITTGTGDFIANGVVSHNCFARPTHRYLDLDAGRDFEREIVVKVNVPEVLRAELGRPSWKREHVALGTNTDPYQWVEGRYRLMPGIWEALRDAANPCSVLTKSPLLLRDTGLFREILARAPFSACLSVPTLDEKAWRATEPHTPHPRARLEAVGELNRAGVPCGVLIAPLMPGINDAPRQVEAILALCAEMGATHVGGLGLHLRGEVRAIFMDWMRSQRPDLVPRYERLYGRGAYLPTPERKRLGALVKPQGRPAFELLRDEPAETPRSRAPTQRALF